jgi:hypothetical protein
LIWIESFLKVAMKFSEPIPTQVVGAQVVTKKDIQNGIQTRPETAYLV